MTSRLGGAFLLLLMSAVLACSSGAALEVTKTTNQMDGGGADAGSADAGLEAPTFGEWSYPSCVTATGACDDSSCRASVLSVSPFPCGTIQMMNAGCVPKDMATTGWGCWVRTADHRIIQSQDLPSSVEGLQTCGAVGLNNRNGYYDSPTCADGGAQ